MGIRTSVTDPLPIADVPVPGTAGVIGLTYCPGKKDPHVKGGAWVRDLALDVAAIHGWGAELVITLLESQEIDLLEVQHLPQEVEARGMRWLHLPIPDGSIPDEAFEARWREHERQFDATLKRGGRVLVHCRGGLGRSGMVAARLLVESGMTPEKAILAVRQVRPRAIETPEQEAYVHRCRRAG
jgi:ADP-ribosyl-[dinitrogen reductase] hydrolase